MLKLKRNLCGLLIAILLLGVAAIPVAAEDNKSDISIKITKVEKSGTQEITYGEATKEKRTMYGYLYITVTWQKDSKATTIMGYTVG